MFYLDLEDDFRGVVAEATAECIEAREDDLRVIKGLNVNEVSKKIRRARKVHQISFRSRRRAQIFIFQTLSRPART